MLQFSSRSDAPGDEVVAANVRELRSAAGLSQAALAQQMRERGHDHWHQTTVSRVESARQGLRLGDVAALNEILRGNVLQGAPMFSPENQEAALARLDHLFYELLDAELISLEDRASGIANDVRALRERLAVRGKMHEQAKGSAKAPDMTPEQIAAMDETADQWLDYSEYDEAGEDHGLGSQAS